MKASKRSKRTFICHLDDPCESADCDYCCPAKVKAVIASARDALFPPAFQCRLVTGMFFYPAAPDGELRQHERLPPDFSDVLAAVGASDQPFLAGATFEFNSCREYWIRWNLLVELPVSITPQLFKTRLRRALKSVCDDPTAYRDFKEIKAAADTNERIERVFALKFGQVHRAIKYADDEDRDAVAQFFEALETRQRIVARNLGRAESGEFHRA